MPGILYQVPGKHHRCLRGTSVCTTGIYVLLVLAGVWRLKLDTSISSPSPKGGGAPALPAWASIDGSRLARPPLASARRDSERSPRTRGRREQHRRRPRGLTLLSSQRRRWLTRRSCTRSVLVPFFNTQHVLGGFGTFYAMTNQLLFLTRLLVCRRQISVSQRPTVSNEHRGRSSVHSSPQGHRGGYHGSSCSRVPGMYETTVPQFTTSTSVPMYPIT